MKILLPEQALKRAIATAFVKHPADVFALMAANGSPVQPTATVSQYTNQLVQLLQENPDFTNKFSEFLVKKNILVDVNYRNATVMITAIANAITSTNNMLGKLVGIGRNRDSQALDRGAQMGDDIAQTIAGMQAEEVAAQKSKTIIGVVLIVAALGIAGLIIYKKK